MSKILQIELVLNINLGFLSKLFEYKKIEKDLIYDCLNIKIFLLTNFDKNMKKEFYLQRQVIFNAFVNDSHRLLKEYFFKQNSFNFDVFIKVIKIKGLSLLLEFFMHCGKNIDDLSLILSQILTPKMLNLKANDFIEHERVYFIFMQD